MELTLRRVLCAACCLVLCFTGGCLQTGEKDISGRMVLYRSESGLLLYDWETKTETLLYDGMYLSAPVFSPDGRYAYVNISSDLFCIELSTAKRRLAAPAARLCDFDGGTALLMSDTEGIVRFDPADGTRTTLVPQPEGEQITHFLYSPDRTRVAYTVCKTEAGTPVPVALYLTEPGGGDPLLFPAGLFAAGAVPIPAAWSPGGEVCYLLAVKPGTTHHPLYALAAADGNVLPAGGKALWISSDGEMRKSADGKYLFAQALPSQKDEAEQIFCMELTTQKITYRATGHAMLYGFWPSADGEMLAFGLGTEDGAGGMYIYGNQKLLQIEHVASGVLRDPVMTADALSVLFVEETAQGGTLRIASVKTAGSSVVLEGIAPPDGVYCKAWRDAWAFYDPQPAS